VAVVGASERPGSPGNEVLVNLRKGGYGGEIFLVNPARDTVGDMPCYADLQSLPGTPEQVVFAVADARVEPVLESAIALGVKAATLFTPLNDEDGAQVPLVERVRSRARAADMLLHGANCMGLLNFLEGVWISGFDTREHGRQGNVALLSQSGAGMCGITDCEERLDFCCAASTGQELGVSIEDYLDYVLDLPQTRVVGLFLETSRYPQRLIAAFEKARDRQIPIVVLKVGKTELAAELALSHSGALAGRDATYQAVFDRYGVQRVDDMAELATALIMFSKAELPGEGALVSLHDSGGERQLAIDMADALKVPMTDLAPSTVEQLEALLDPGLPAINPLDAWGASADAPAVMGDCFTVMLSDPNAALGAVIHDRAPGGGIYAGYVEYMRQALESTGKPVFLVANHQGSGTDPQVLEATQEGMPVVDGLRPFLVGVRCLLEYRNFQGQEKPTLPPAAEKAVIDRWSVLLESGENPGEFLSGELLRDFGVPVIAGQLIESVEELAGLQLEFPVVLKTAAPGIAHKSEAGGVCLNLDSAQALQSAYLDMAARLGPGALVFPMVDEAGVEMLLGLVRDEQFGPVVIMGAGGVYAEIFRDTVSLLPPFSAECAHRALGKLAVYESLGEFRGRGPLAIEAYCEAAARLGCMALALGESLAELEINPMLLTQDRCIGLDALGVGAGSRKEC
jgi:acyl-CoA synthetase (NDP forming)